MFQNEIHDLFEQIARRDDCHDYYSSKVLAWPEALHSQMIFNEQVGAQLGGPYGSIALSILYPDAIDGKITIIGDVGFKPESFWGRLSLVKIAVHNPEDYYTYQQKLLLVPVKYYLDGAMIRIQPSEYKEWIRIHNNFIVRYSSINLIARMHTWYKEIEGVEACQSIVICNRKDAMDLLIPIVERHRAIMKTFAKRLNEHLQQCDTCDNSQICREINSIMRAT